MRQRFEYKEGNSNKFWEIEQSAQSVTTWWGRIGTAGQSKIKDCGTAAKAKAEVEKLIAEKAGKGYVSVSRTSGPAEPKKSSARSSAVERRSQKDGEDFAGKLAAFEEWLRDGSPSVHKALRRGATDKEMAKIAERLFSGELPADLDTWFRWHNGQELDAQPILPDYENRGFYLLSVAEAIRAYSDIKAVDRAGELSGTWKPTWVPLLESDFGDFIVLETEGRDQGTFRVLWHETSKRPIVAVGFPSLLALCRKAPLKEKPAKGDVKKPAWDFLPPKKFASAKVEKCPLPTAEELKLESTGVAFVVGPFSTNIYPFRAHYLAIKLGEDCWISVEEHTLDEGLQAIRHAVGSAPIKKWRHTECKIASELTAHSKIWKRQIRRCCVEF
jgi:predicted DNA-binding WGR domain protein/cell wall assembly regulator SMI1